jgi:26S proteasome regulatory subunit N2
VPTAVLSTTAKAKERARKKDAEKKGTTPASTKADAPAAGADKMDTDEAAGTAATKAEGEAGADGAAAGAGAGGEEATKAAEAKKEEPSTHMVENPARVVPAQVKFVSFAKDSRCVVCVCLCVCCTWVTGNGGENRLVCCS